MKSDREFLDGIYQKAAKYSEPRKKIRGQYQMLSGLAACLLLCILGIGVIYTRQKAGNKEALEQEGVVAARSLAEMEQDSPAPKTFSLDNEGIATAQVDPEATMQKLPTLIVAGSIAALLEEGTAAEVLVEDCYYGTCPDTSLQIKYIKNNAEEEIGVLFSEGEQVLLILTGEEDGWFLLTDGQDSKYQYVSGIGESAIYKGQDGFSGTPEEIKEKWIHPLEEENYGIQ